MIVSRQEIFPVDSDGRVSGLTMARLGSELAVAYHDVFAAPLPSRLQGLIDALDRSLAERSRSGTAGRPRAVRAPSD